MARNEFSKKPAKPARSSERAGKVCCGGGVRRRRAGGGKDGGVQAGVAGTGTEHAVVDTDVVALAEELATERVPANPSGLGDGVRFPVDTTRLTWGALGEKRIRSPSVPREHVCPVNAR